MLIQCRSFQCLTLGYYLYLSHFPAVTIQIPYWIQIVLPEHKGVTKKLCMHVVHINLSLTVIHILFTLIVNVIFFKVLNH